MFRLDPSASTGWTKEQDLLVPQSVDITCPHCGKIVNIRCRGKTADKARNCISTSGECSSCRGKVDFWIITGYPEGTKEGPRCLLLAMFPHPKLQRQPIDNIAAVPEGIRKAYVETVKAFNAGLWSATGNCCRRTLEGIIKNKLSAQDAAKSDSLESKIRKLSNDPDLIKTLITLAHYVREGGNISSHFDLEKETDEPTADAMIDLLEYMLQYVYRLPKLIERFGETIEALDKKDAKPS